MPVRNASQFLLAAANSILAQSHTDFEFLIIDDGSTDGSRAMIDDLAEADSRVRVLTNPDPGLIGALNTGIRAARAPFIARMDADDISHPDRLRQQLARMQDEPRLGALGCAVQVINADGDIVRRVRHPSGIDQVRRAVWLTSIFAHPSVMFRAQAVREAGLYRQRFFPAEDYDLWLRVSARWELDNLDKPLLDYRVHDGQITQLKAIAQARAAAEAVTDARGVAVSRRDDPVWHGHFVSHLINNGGIATSEGFRIVAGALRRIDRLEKSDSTLGPQHGRGTLALRAAVQLIRSGHFRNGMYLLAAGMRKRPVEIASAAAKFALGRPFWAH